MSLQNDKHFFELLTVWIDENLDKDLSLDAVSFKSGFSKRYLQECFRNFTGQSIGEYIRLRRLTLAYMMLRITNLTPFEIAKIYRWESQQSFTRAFRTHFGIPPSALRKKETFSHEKMFPIYSFDKSIKYEWYVGQAKKAFKKDLIYDYEVSHSDFVNESIHYNNRVNILSDYSKSGSPLGGFVLNIEVIAQQRTNRGTIKIINSLGEIIKFENEVSYHENDYGIINGLYLHVYFSSKLDGLGTIIHYAHQEIMPLTKMRSPTKDIIIEVNDYDAINNKLSGVILLPLVQNIPPLTKGLDNDG